ncbi:MAG: Flp pilus assembly protein CpaB [Chloroflexi bacterium]|nr:MAG: Flp pilus assembly protein CpaB [Chloroflexota bacterium]
MALPLPIPPPARPAAGVRTPLFLLGVGMALLAFIGMFAFGIVFANRGLTGRQVPVVVAAVDIQAREPINIGMLALGQTTASSLPPHAFVSLGDLSGYSAVVPIYKGQPITANIVATDPDQIQGGSNAYLPIPQGYVAMTLPSGEQQGVAGYVTPGDYINIIATVNTGIFNPTNPHMATRTVFSNLHVIRVGPPSASPKEGQAIGVSTSVTVILTECDAQYLNWLLANVTLKYVLLSYKDYDVKPPTPDATCPSTTAPAVVGPIQVDSRWAFTKV